ncbi:substrate-binding periplasmic protein [Flocculibacter collagenilyticus]|uniref:substrate-binding periplasmic protein n=1 Tax=Flocculibacter collagenilyticus TaxID=2744479 RepID=UPI0018F4CA61|nr:ABC transporter substrate-binding protein [Flocculibacter collagenilyticus]
MRTNVLLPLLISFLLIVPLSSHAHTVIIALGDFQPMFAPEGEPALFKSIIDGVYKHIPDRQVQYLYMMPTKRLLNMLNKGEADGAANIFNQAEVQGCITDPVFRYEDVVITRTSKKFKIMSLEELSGKTVVGYQRALNLLGDKYKAFMEKNPKYQEVGNVTDQARLLSQDLVDVSIGDKYLFLHSLKQIAQDKFNPSDYQIHTIFPPVYTYMGFNDQQYCDEFNTALKKFQESGEYEKVYSQFLKVYGYATP